MATFIVIELQVAWCLHHECVVVLVGVVFAYVTALPVKFGVVFCGIGPFRSYLCVTYIGLRTRALRLEYHLNVCFYENECSRPKAVTVLQLYINSVAQNSYSIHIALFI